MEVTSATMTRSSLTDDEKVKELKEFDETKAGVKGLMDSGLAKIPRIFICPPVETVGENGSSPLQVPIINLRGLGSAASRTEIVDEIRLALETWGFFQIVNHGVPNNAMEKLLKCIRQFHELPQESKMEFYSRDYNRKVKYYSTGDLYLTKTAQWKDSLSCDFKDDAAVDSESLPSICREAISAYINYMAGLRNVVSELLSEALGLESDKLASMECLDISRLLCHYYPPCPEPQLTQGIVKHSDPYFLTILLQDNIGGLQVYHQNQWVDVPPVQGSLIVNAGDMLQLITNDKFISVEHRVKAGPIGPRISAACFLFPTERNGSKPYGPLNELLSESNLPKYRETSYNEYIHCYAAKGLDGVKTLPHFKHVPVHINAEN